MKYLQRLFILLTISAAVFSCQKEYSVENNGGNLSASAQWSFTEGSAQFKGPIDTVTVDTVGNVVLLTINGHSADKKDLFNLQVFGPELKIGTYKTPYNLFSYGRSGIVLYQTNPTDIDSFTVVLTKFDSTGVAGTFSGKAYDSSKASKRIVDGKFSSVFKTTPVTPVSTDSGQVVLWSKAGCGGGTSTSPISVSIGSKTGQITKFSATAPTSCDSTGGFYVKLPVGSYSLVARCGNDSLTGVVTVMKNTCTKVELTLTGSTAPVADYFPTTANSNWSYKYENGTPADTLYTLSTGFTGTIAGQTGTFSLFTDQDASGKDSSLYKKANNAYYAYSPAEKIDSLGIDVPAFVYTFLKDNVAAGGTFTDGPIAGKVNGIPGNIYLNSTIIDTGATATINSIPFTSIIKVKTIYSFKVGSISTPFYEAEQWFAKGVGLIKLLEYSTAPFTTPDDVLDITRSKVY